MKDEELKDEQQQKKKEKKPPKKNKKAVGVFAKKYLLEKAEKKLFSRIYVDSDREYARSLFVETEDKKGRKYLVVPKETRFTKKEIKRLKLISKDVKSQKGRVKTVALLITAALIAGAIIFISLFKDTLVKKAIKAGGEAAFGAACDIGSVSFKPLAGYLSIHDLEIADKGSPWKNVVQIDEITSDFDLTLLLQGKFIVEEMSITGIQTGTDRRYDGTLAPKEKKAKRAKKAKKEKDENAEPSKLALKVSEISDEMYGRFTSALSDLFDQYDPEKILANLYTQLTIPDAVNDAMDFGQELTGSLKQKASELEGTATGVKDSIETVVSLDYKAALKNPLLIKDYYAIVMDAVNTAVDAYEEAVDTVDYVKGVAGDVVDQYEILTAAAGKDTEFLKGQVDVMKGITAGDAFDFLADTGSDLVKTVLGEAYGYIETGITYIKSLKKDEKPKKEKPAPAERAEGRTITYRNHNEPKVWIKYLEGSGPKLQFTAKNISSDEKAAGGPAVLDFNGHDLAFSLGSDSGKKPGLAAAALFDLNATIHDSGEYKVEGSLALAPFVLSAGTFKPEIASDIVNSVFARFDSVTAGFTAASSPNGMKFTFDTDIGNKLYNAIMDEWNVQLERVKEMILAELKARIEEYVNQAVQSLTGYGDLESAISGYTAQIEGYKKQLEAKKQEVSDLIDNTINAIMDEVERLKAEAERLLREAETAVKEKVEELKKQAEAALAEAERLKKEAEQAIEQVQQMKDDAVNAVQEGAQNALNAAEKAKADAEEAVRAELERKKKEAEDAAKAEIERLKQEAEAKAEAAKREAEAKLEAAKQEAEAKAAAAKKEAEEKAAAAKKAAEDAAKAAEEAAKAEAERLKKEAEEAAAAEAERLKKEAEAAAKKSAEDAAKKAAGSLKKLF